MKKYFLFFCVLGLLSCNDSSRNLTSLSLFFNPSKGFNVEEFHLTAKLNGEALIDTVVLNTKVDKSLLIKCIRIDNVNNKLLELTINGKSKSIKLTGIDSKCIAVFSSYDDHSRLQKMYSNIETQKQYVGQPVEYKATIDSIKKSKSLSELDSVIVNIQKDKCLCNDIK